QLGVVSVCVEMDKTLGGTCVNVGCIPSKALLNSSEHYEFMRTHAAHHGIATGDVTIDVAQMLKRKDEVVGQNTKGIEFLFRKNKVTWAKGFGVLGNGNVVEVVHTRPEASGHSERETWWRFLIRSPRGPPPPTGLPPIRRRASSFPPAPYQSSS